MPSQFCRVDLISQSFDRIEGFLSQFPLPFPRQREPSANWFVWNAPFRPCRFNVPGIELVPRKAAGGENFGTGTGSTARTPSPSLRESRCTFRDNAGVIARFCEVTRSKCGRPAPAGFLTSPASKGLLTPIQSFERVARIICLECFPETAGPRRRPWQRGRDRSEACEIAGTF